MPPRAIGLWYLKEGHQKTVQHFCPWSALAEQLLVTRDQACACPATVRPAHFIGHRVTTGPGDTQIDGIWVPAPPCIPEVRLNFPSEHEQLPAT
jgi:hypothetical protein